MAEHDKFDPFVYRANVLDVVDGDTVACALDLGFNLYLLRHVRLLDVDTREIHFVSHGTEEYERGMVHKRFTEDWVLDAIDDDGDRPFYERWPFYVQTDLDRRGSYGRVLGTVWAHNHETSLNQALLDAFNDVEEW